MITIKKRVLMTAIGCLDGELQRLQDSRLAVIQSGNQQACDEHIFKTGELALARGYLNAMAEEPSIRSLDGTMTRAASDRLLDATMRDHSERCMRRRKRKEFLLRLFRPLGRTLGMCG